MSCSQGLTLWLPDLVHLSPTPASGTFQGPGDASPSRPVRLSLSPAFPRCSPHLAPPDLRAGAPERGPLHPQLLAPLGPPRAPRVHPLPSPPDPLQGTLARAGASEGVRGTPRLTPRSPLPLSTALLLGRRQPHSFPQSPCQPSAHGLRKALRPWTIPPDAIKVWKPGVAVGSMGTTGRGVHG